MPKTKYLVELTWKVKGATSGLGGFNIYGNPDADTSARGELLKKVPNTARVAKFEVEAGDWIFRVVPISANGNEWPWKNLSGSMTFKKVNSGALPTPSTPTSVSMGFSKPATASVTAAPRSSDDQGTKAEIIEGPSSTKGKLVAEVDMPEDAGGGQDASLHQQHALPISGYGQSSRDLHIRTFTPGRNKASTEVSRTGHFMQPMAYAAVTEIMKVKGTGAAVEYTNVAAPGSSDEWEADVDDGARARQIPTRAAMGSEWGSPTSGLLKDIPLIAAYVNTVVIESSEVDLTVKMRGFLDIYDEWQRKSDVAFDINDRWKRAPWPPERNPWPDDPYRDTESRRNGRWFGSLVTGEGKPTEPIRDVKWEVKWGDSSPISMEYVPYRPGMVIAARYVRCRNTVHDPLGLWQLKCPLLLVNFIHQRSSQYGLEAVGASTPTKVVTIAADEILGGTPFPNAHTIQVTPDDQRVNVGVTVDLLATGTRTFTITCIDVTTGTTPTFAWNFYWFVEGY